MIHYIIMTVMDIKSIMHSGIAYDIDPNDIIGSDRWSYALYITESSKKVPINYENIWKNVPIGKNSITYHKSKYSDDIICEIECQDDMKLLRLYLEELIEQDDTIEYTYILKRIEDGYVKLYCGSVKELINNKHNFIEYICLVMT